MNTGKIIPIAFPDTFVCYGSEAVQLKLFPKVGLGNRGYIKAGHAILVLIENSTGNIQYFDFGRYVTPPKMGRVRSAKTDADLHIPLKAIITESGEIQNLEEILLWLGNHPEKTHGDGRMVASVCHEVNYEKAINYLTHLQDQGSIPYLAFSNSTGSNCSRLVTDTLIRSGNNKRTVKKLKRNNKFTPSPLGNVKYGAAGGEIYNVFNGKISLYSKSILKENLTNYFDPNAPVKSGIPLPKQKGKAQLLSGIGASAYFEIIATELQNQYIIKRYTSKFEKDFEGLFTVDNSGFNITKPYQFIFDSNCNYCHISQADTIYKFDVIG